MSQDGCGCLISALFEMLAWIWPLNWPPWSDDRVKAGDYADAMARIEIGGTGTVLLRDRKVRAHNVGSRVIEAHHQCRVVRIVGRFVMVTADPKTSA
jgi:hypothetical protein